MNLDTLVRIGQRPWRPVPAAADIDVWDKYDFPNCGTFRLGDDLIVFTLITTAGNRSLWAYVPVPPGQRGAVAGAHFDAENEFDAFLDGCFTGREAVFAAAENFVITAKSDGILIPPTSNALLAAGAGWYAGRAAALAGITAVVPAIGDTDAETLLRVAQGALTRG